MALSHTKMLDTCAYGVRSIALAAR